MSGNSDVGGTPVVFARVAERIELFNLEPDMRQRQNRDMESFRFGEIWKTNMIIVGGGLLLFHKIPPPQKKIRRKKFLTLPLT